jgi:hypothetical protein
MASRSNPRRALVAACIGNAVEWHHFALYGAFATILAITYFPSAGRDANLLAAFAVFSTAFIFGPWVPSCSAAAAIAAAAVRCSC